MMIFFDIDETLLNQRAAEAAAVARLLEHFAAVLPPTVTAELLCRRWRSLREKHAPAFLSGAVSYDEHHRRRIRELFLDGAALSDAECDARYGVYLAAYREAWRLFDDVIPTLDALEHYRLGILSNGNAAQQRAKLASTGILDRFSVIIISEEAGWAKPDRGIFLEARRQADVGDGRCIHVGDRLDADARGSCAVGMRGIWLDRRRTESMPRVETIHSLEQLPERLDESDARHRDAG